MGHSNNDRRITNLLIQGNPQKMFELGHEFASQETDESTASAAECFRHAAQMNHAGAARAYGRYLIQGVGGETDQMTGVKWLKAAVAGQDSNALHDLGVCFLNGIGTTSNSVMATECMRAAAKLGNAHAREFLNKLDPS